MADERGSTSDSEAAAPVARRLTKLLSMPCSSSSISILENLNIRSNQQASPAPVPPPLLPQRASPQNQILNVQGTLPPATSISPHDLHPIIEIMRVPPPLLPQRASPQNQILKVQGTLPPATSISPPARNMSNDLHPIIEIMQDQELGKLVINLAVPVSIALFLTSNGNSLQKPLVVHEIAVGLMIGCTAIWNGILFRRTFSRLANILEQFGISLVLLVLYGLVASFLPKGFSCACWLCGALCLIPFIYARIKAAGQA